jgi:protein-S-isoprenylcysteine O-methyltransferase Ste14
MPGSLSLSLLLAGTILLVALSWRSLGQPRSHGFFRFFAFEAILCIVVVNAPVWFHRPFAPMHLLSWALLLVSLALVIHGFYLLRKLGQPSKPAPGSPMFGVENTASLVTTGAFRFIRHPLYASLLYLAWGAALKSLTPLSLVLALLATAALVATAKAEEREDIRRFGDVYREYMTHTRWLFIPFVL